VPEYKVVAHRKVYKFLTDCSDPTLKIMFKERIAKLEYYPLSLREMDAEVIRGVKNTFRLRVGGYRIIFFVDKPAATIYVTDIKLRKKAYTK
jgi:mRNA interferase RelE/StbE